MVDKNTQLTLFSTGNGVELAKNGFLSDVHYRANLAFQEKKDRTDSSQETQFFVRLIPDMRPTTKNIVAHDASNILNREANYFWCSRKANQESGTQTQKKDYSRMPHITNEGETPTTTLAIKAVFLFSFNSVPKISEHFVFSDHFSMDSNDGARLARLRKRAARRHISA
ncbi:hypothetical protein OUZ56_005448 [Daphnia magna]|uniref:Uncharacterized protein n=1 Tax=Daphnia magna TaxID=35525 RepID=A0ABQ9YTJ9_9CRUS|nr:hypothetical protein OUZ56_005448 [Daphnia magna]